MSIIEKMGFRHYEFGTAQDLAKAREIWATPCDQNTFEDEMEAAGVDFTLDLLVAQEAYCDELEEESEEESSTFTKGEVHV